MFSGLWFIWGAGFFTGGMASYLGCILFCRRILKKQGEIVNFLTNRQRLDMDDAALNSFLDAWKRQMEGYKPGKYSQGISVSRSEDQQ